MNGNRRTCRTSSSSVAASAGCAPRGAGPAPVRVTVVDRHNHHLFQPLLYQVATAELSPADIAAPIRGILRRQRNTEVLLAEVDGVDVAARRSSPRAVGRPARSRSTTTT